MEGLEFFLECEGKRGRGLAVCRAARTLALKPAFFLGSYPPPKCYCFSLQVHLPVAYIFHACIIRKNLNSAGGQGRLSHHVMNS